MDVAGVPIGRAASLIASTLRGKTEASFLYRAAPDIFVEVKNVGKMKIIARKMLGKTYKRYTGYPGGLRETSLEELFKRDPREVLRKAVWGMLPKNKLRAVFIKHLIFV